LRRLADLTKQKPHRPHREQTIEAATHDPTYAAQYPRSPRAANRANNYFSPRAGTKLYEQTPSSGVGEAWRYGRGAGGEHNVQTPTAGALLETTSRYRQGERLTRRGSRKRPPYGTKIETTRVIQPLADYIEQESFNQPRKHNLRPRARGAARDAGRVREMRRQGEMSLDKQTAGGAGVSVGSGSAANVQGALHVAGYGEQRRRKRRKAKLLAKRAELNAVADILHMAKVRNALAQADDALRTVDNASKVLKGFHPDGHVFTVWERAIELLKQEQERPVTMKGLR
jgi:hypothetical protein